MNKIHTIQFLSEEIEKETSKQFYSKTKVREYLKTIRRLSLEYEKEMRRTYGDDKESE